MEESKQDPNVVFRFLDNNLEEFKKPAVGRQAPVPIDPIITPKCDFNLAYVAEEIGGSAGNGFIVVLTTLNGQNLTPKLIKFGGGTKDANTWEITGESI